jgi:zinc protease
MSLMRLSPSTPKTRLTSFQALLTTTSILWILAFLFVSASLHAQTSAGEELIPFDAATKHGKLGNGLTYYVRENHKPAKQLQLMLVVNAGSVLEDDGQEGLAHFSEHMAFNGTKSFKRNDLISFLQSIGMDFGNDLNAYTSFDETAYTLTIPVQKKENVEKGFQVLEEWASHVSYHDADIDSERAVVLEELRLGKGAQDRITTKFLPRLFAGSRYADRRPIGKEEVIKTFPHQKIKNFYADWYRPDLMAVIVVGDINEAEGVKMIHKHFDHLEMPKKIRPRPAFDIPKRETTEALVITDKELPITSIQVFYPIEPYTEETRVSEYRGRIVRNLFESMMARRLYELSQLTDAPFLAASSSLTSVLRGQRGYISSAVVGPPGVEKALRTIIHENLRVREFGFLASELERAGQDVLQGIEATYRQRDQIESESLASELSRNFLTNEVVPGVAREYQYYKDFIPTITPEEVTAYARSVIPDRAQYFALLTAPETESKNLPDSDKLKQIVADASNEKVTPYTEEKIQALNVVPSEVSQIVRETYNKTLDITKISLNNGVTLLLKPTKFKEDEFLLSGFRPGGTSAYEEADHYNLKYLTDIISHLGMGSYSPVKLQKVLAGKRANVDFSLDTYFEAINVSASTKDIETAFKLLHLGLTSPNRDVEAYEGYKKQRKSAWEHALNDPRTIFSDQYSDFIYNKHPRRPAAPRPEDLNSVNLDRVFQIFNERFTNLRGYTFVLIGNFDVKTAKELAGKYLGYGNNSPIAAGQRDIGLFPIAGYKKVTFYSGQEPKSLALLSYSGKRTYNDMDRLRLAALSEVLQLRAIEKLREEAGGVYTVGVRSRFDKYPKGNFNLTISLPCAPSRVNELRTIMLQEIAQIQKNSPSQAEIQKVITTLKNQYDKSTETNEFWLASILSYLQRDEDPNLILSFKERIDKIKPETIKRTTQYYLQNSNLLEAVHLPEESTPKKYLKNRQKPASAVK